MEQLNKKNRVIKIIVTLFILAFSTLFAYKRIVYDVKIQDYIELNRDHYLVVFYYDYFLSSSNYNATIVSFENPQWFYNSVDQHNVYFTIDDYERIEVEADTLIIYTDDSPNILIQKIPYVKLEFRKP